MVPGELYVIPADVSDGEEWLQPRPVEELVVDAIVDATEYDADDLDPLAEYVEYESLASLFDGTDEAETVSFDVEGCEVTISAAGDVEVVEVA